MISKPVKRSRLRIWLGKRFFIQKRRLQWWFGSQKFAKELSENPLQETITSHQSILLRKLRDVDMHLQHNKIMNLKIAAKKISGIIIRPGTYFSFWNLVGQPSRSKGYLKGMMLYNGQVIEGTGGGLCQLSNLIYWMVLHSPLTVTERWRHGYDVFPDSNRTQPFGSGATLSYNYIDLQLFNATSQEFQINIWLTKQHLHGEIRSNLPISSQYKVIEENHRMVGQPWGGYTRHNEIYREVTEKSNDQMLRKEFITANNAIMMYQPFLENQDQEL